MSCSLNVIPTTANPTKSILEIVPKFVVTKMVQAQP